jgi:hypothetical protein
MFQIDTGLGGDRLAWVRIDRSDGLLCGVMDSLPPDATQAQIDAAMVSMILSELRTPRTLKTVRRRLLQLWPLFAELAQEHSEPAQADAILIEYAERVTELPA